MKLFLYLFMGILLCVEGAGMAMGRPKTFSAPPAKHPGLYVRWECSIMADHVPPLPEAADKVFKQARALEKRGGLTPGEAEEVLKGYEQAARMGHWKAINNLVACYMYGRGTAIDYDEAAHWADQLIAMKVGLGYYAKYIMLKKGWGMAPDRKAADKNLHLAADYGEPHAQYELGIYYLYPERREIQGLRYIVCAARQGHAEAASDIGIYLDMFDNKYMAVEYFYRAVSLGFDRAALRLYTIFDSRNKPDDFRNNYGFQANDELARSFYGYYNFLKKHPGTRIPDLFKKHPLPKNVLMTREQSRAMPSKLKDAFGGRWPDEIFPELAPDYLPPKL